MANEEDEFGLNASNYFSEVDRILQYAEEWRKSNLAIAQSLVGTESAVDGFTFTITKMVEAGTQISQTFELIDGAMTEVASSFKTNLGVIDAQHNAMTRLIETQDLEIRKAQELAAVGELPNLISNLIARKEAEDALVATLDLQHNAMTRLIEAQDLEIRKARELAATAALPSIIPNLIQENLLREKAAEEINELVNAKNRELIASELIQSQERLSIGFIEARAVADNDRLVALDAEQAKLDQQLQILAGMANAEEIVAQTEAKLLAFKQQEITAELKLAAIRARDRSRGIANEQAEQLQGIKDTEKATLKAQAAADSLVVSWQNFGRLLLTQQVHRLIYLIVNAMQEAHQEAEQFELRISEIRTISQQNQLSFEQWAGSIRDVSDAFGTPLLQTTEAAYQVLSNRVATGAQTFGFLRTSLEFSQATMSSAKDSVNLLTSAINSFHLSTDQASRVAAVFINTIQDGRLRAEDLANIFGRVGGLAHAVGLSIEDTTAALTAMTVNGIPANEAMTLLNNVLSHLLRPTKEMQGLFDDLGVSSAQTAVKAYTFTGLLQKMDEYAGGSSEKMADLTRDIRDLRGALGLTGDNLERVKRNLEDMNNIKRFELDKKIAVESAGRKFEIEINKIKNFFIEDFGRPFLKMAVEIGEATNKLGISNNGLVDDISVLTKAVISATEAFVLYQVAVKTATIYNEIFSGTKALEFFKDFGTQISLVVGNLRRMGAALAATKIGQFITSPATLAVVALGALIYRVKSVVDAEDEAIRAINTLEVTARDEAEKTTEAFRQNLDVQNRNFEESLDLRFQHLLLFSAQVNRLLANLQASQVRAVEAATIAARDSLKTLVTDTESMITGLNNELRTAASLLEDIHRNIEETIAGIKRSSAEHKIALLPAPEQVAALFKQVHANIRLANEQAQNTDLQGDLLGGGSAEDIKNSRKVSIDAQTAAQADLNKITDKHAETQREIEALLREREEIEKRIAGHSKSQDQNQETAELIEKHRELILLKKKGRNVEAEALEKQIVQSRALAGSDRREESDREEAQKLADVERRLAVKRKILEATEKEGDLATVFENISKSMVDTENLFADATERAADAAKNQLEIEKAHLRGLRNLLGEIDKIKAPTNIITEEAAKQFLDQHFEKPIQDAIESGALNSPEVLQKILEQELAIRRQFDTQITEDHRKVNDELLAKDLERIKQISDAEHKALKETEIKGEAARDVIRDLFIGGKDANGKEIDARLPALLATDEVQVGTKQVRGFGPKSGSVSRPIFETLKDVGNDFLEGRINGKRLTELFTQASQNSLATITKGGTDEQRLAFEQAGNDLQRALTALKEAADEKTAHQQAIAQIQKDLEAAKLTEQKARIDAIKASQENTKTVEDLIVHIQSLNAATENLNKTLLQSGADKLPPAHSNPNVSVPDLGTGPQSLNFKPLVPGALNIPDSAVRGAIDNSTNVQTLTLNVTTSKPVDAQFLQRQLQDGLRRGTFKLQQEDGGLG